MAAENTDDMEKYLEEHADELEDVDDEPWDEAKFKEMLERMNAAVRDITNDQEALDTLNRILHDSGGSDADKT